MHYTFIVAIERKPTNKIRPALKSSSGDIKQKMTNLTNKPTETNQQKIKATALIASGQHLINEKKWSEAVYCLLQALNIDPKNAAGHVLIAQAYKEQNLLKKALDSYLHALELAPNNPDYLYNLALFHQENKNFSGAERYYLKLLAAEPEYADALANLGRLYQDTNLPDQARFYYEKDLKLRPDDPDSHLNLAFIHLLCGDYESGWKEYGWRFQRKAAKSTYPHTFAEPRWTGNPFPGQILFIHGEQGFGDNLQFMRYLPMVKERGGKVIFEVRKELAPLFKNYPGIDQLTIYNPLITTQETFDFFIPLLDLPRIFATTQNTIPAPTPVLKAPEQLCRHWETILKSPRYKVGLVWGGNILPDPARSCPAKELASLCEIDGIDFYGLQTGKPARETGELEKTPGFRENLGSQSANFADSAAIISQLDLVITIDTAMAHLAGTMGIEVWVLLPYAPDWRWFLERSDSPWYPTMRLFRQPDPDNWQSVVSEIKNALRQNLQ